jgi:hypothetical protein
VEVGIAWGISGFPGELLLDGLGDQGLDFWEVCCAVTEVTRLASSSSLVLLSQGCSREVQASRPKRKQRLASMATITRYAILTQHWRDHFFARSVDCRNSEISLSIAGRAGEAGRARSLELEI